MKLPIDNNYLEVGGNVSEITCTIGDPNLILSYLRDKIYVNRPRVVVQEIACNARDANIENGYPDVPIKIKTPTIFDPFWECSDNGAGMNPQIMESVYSSVGTSTKRSNDDVLGKYGVGSKSPLSISSQFSISTCAWEGDHKVRREYFCVLAENRAIELLEFHDTAETTDSPTGTVIRIPIESKDFQSVINYSKEVTKFWKVPPIINNEEYKPQLPEYLYKYDDFCITKNPLGYSNGVILGEIFYPIDLGNLKFNNILTQKFANKILLKFQGSELNVNIGRESLDYDDQTRTTIINRLNEALEVVQQEAVDAVAGAVSLWDAHIAYGKHADILGRRVLKWNGHEISSNNIKLPKGTKCRLYRNGEKSLEVSEYNTISAGYNNAVVFKDVASAVVLRSESLMDTHRLNNIYLVENPLEHLVEICAGFPKLSEGQYTRKKTSIHVWHITYINKFNQSSWSHEDAIEKEKILIDDADFSDYSCYVEYDSLYGLNRQLLKVVCDEANLIAVTAKSLKYVVDELPTFDEYVKMRAASIPDKVIKLRELKKCINRSIYIKKVNCSLMDLYEEIFAILDKEAVDKAASPLYSVAAKDERGKPVRDFIEELNNEIVTEYPMLSNVVFDRLSENAKNQLIEFFNFVAKKRPADKFTKLTESFKELSL